MDPDGSNHVNTNRGSGNQGTRYANRHQSQLLRTPQNRTDNDDQESSARQHQSTNLRSHSRFSIDSNIHPRLASHDSASEHSTPTPPIPLTLLEQQAPTLTASTKVAYDAFVILYAAYVMKGGVQLFKDRISPQAKNGYRTRIKQIDTLDNDELQIALKSIHYEKGTLKSANQFATMPRTEVYVRETCDTYHDVFSNKYYSDTTRTSDMTEEAVAKAFINGIGFLPLRNRIADSHPQNFDDTSEIFYKNLDDFDIHKQVEVYYAAAKRSSLSRPSLINPSPVPLHPTPGTSTLSQPTYHKPTRYGEGVLAAAAIKTLPGSSQPDCVNCNGPHHGRNCTFPCALCEISGFSVNHKFKDCPSIGLHISKIMHARSQPLDAHQAIIPELTVQERDEIFQRFEERDALIAQYGEELISTIEQEHPEYWEQGVFHHRFN